ncbi:NUDIX hydrolase [Falsarthrobacter nasiphocae]|uniref:ADP-ribose pyrophosphatase n=1 Tax=Falsarthrobacter nasiphocae TaxID=189863 RepID=A0AAE3YHB9_9MICC|nr:NUDIX hydrolase [Falsarthrobacter nasiphocae]MDR6892727.1 ADP-ribose pyrophosphatase [Falsarthrobacter nasiphocae]
MTHGAGEQAVPRLGREELVDEPSQREVLSHEVLQRGHVQTLVREEFRLSGDVTLTRDFVQHPGAVVVAALNERNELLMIRQYRHPARMLMWELPAGLLDVEGESPWDGAPRELAEEADAVASEWHTLVDVQNSAGGSTEATRVFLARGLTPVPDADLHERDAEEAEIERAWVPVEEAVAAVFAGTVHNVGAVLGILAVDRFLAGSLELRPADAPWQAHPRHADWS